MTWSYLKSWEEINGKLEMLSQVLEAHVFCLSRSKVEYMKFKFNNGRANANLEVKTGDHILPQVT